ncbi:hypothetical protein [Nostoc sp.]|uniref:hypothetical protein n=1 Tax=Nostoc sp. TaxID=1180 RepID=UPI002FF95903
MKLLLFFRWLLQVIRNFIITLVGFLGAGVNYIRQGFKHLRKFLARKKIVIFVLLLLLSFGTITFSIILPHSHIFEGSLTVGEISFTYNGQEPKLFLQSMRSISNLESEGVQTLNFAGKFESESFPQLNQLKDLKIELNSSESKFIIAPANSKLPSEIDLTKLLLQPNTEVAGLSYDSYNKRLDFSLQPQPISKLDNKPNDLKLYLGEQPLKVSLEGYELPSVKLPNRPEQTVLEFIYLPDNKELNLELAKDTNLYITTTAPYKNDLEQWFRGKIFTKNVNFQRIDRSGDIRDDLAISTIIEGKIRMVEQEKDIKDNQFLMGEKPDIPLNIELIRYLQIVPNKGLEVRIAGKAQQIKIGLDKDFPVSSIQGSWLDGILPRDAIIAIFSFGAATISYLLSVLIDNISKSAPKS